MGGMLPEDSLLPGDTGAEAEPAPQEGGAILRHTVDEIPGLADLGVGDSITLQVVEVADDGTYSLSAATEEVGEEPAPTLEEAMPQAGGGVADALV